MSAIQLVKPAANVTQNVACESGAEFVFDFATGDVVLSKSESGDHLVMTFDDGAKLVLENFYGVYNAENMPAFVINGTSVPGGDFFGMMDHTLSPAAGPTASAAALARGGRDRSFGDMDFLGGINRLGGLDIGFAEATRQDETPFAAYTLPDIDPVTISPALGEAGTPPAPLSSSSYVVLNLDNPLVSESGLDGGTAAGSGANVTSGTINIGSGNGVAVIVVNGQVIWRDGELVNDTVDTGLGELRISSYDPATHTITYTYTLTDNDTSGEDATDNFTITVTDNDGNTGTGTLVVTVKDDAPIAHDDANHLLCANNAAIDGNVVTGEVNGTVDPAMADAVGADGLGGVTWGAIALDGGGAVTQNLDGTYQTPYGTLTLKADGSYTLDSTSATVATPGTDKLTAKYTVTDGDDDTAEATLSISITVPGILALVDSNSIHAGETYDALRGTEAIAGGNVGRDADTLTPLVIRSAEGVDTITIGGTAVVQNGALVVNEVTTPHGKLIVDGFAVVAGGAQLTYKFMPFDSSIGSEPDIAVNVTDKLGQSRDGTIHLKIFDAPVPPDQNGNPVTIAPAAITAPNVGTVPAADWQPEGLPNPDTLSPYPAKFDDVNNDYELKKSSDVTFSETAWNGLGGDDTITIWGRDWGKDMTFTDVALQGGTGDDSIKITSYNDPMHITLTSTIVDGGEGRDNIVIGEHSWDTTLEKSRVTGGAGNDTITIDSDGGGKSATSLNDTRVDGGDGDDSISIGLASPTTSLKGAVVTGGAGGDAIKVGGGYGHSLALKNSLVDGGNGNNTIEIGVGNITQGMAELDAVIVSSGEGADTIKIGYQSKTKLDNTDISSGGGADSIVIGGDILNSNAHYTVTQTSVSGEGGNDTISIGNGGYTATLENTRVDGGADNDSISIGHVVDKAELKDVVVEGGLGNDTIDVSWYDKTYSSANDVTLENTTLYGGGGEDIIRVGGKHGSANGKKTTFENVAVDGGADSDQISVGGGEQTLHNATISGGAGGDFINIGDTRQDPTRNTVTLNETTVDGGADDDFIFIHRREGAVSLEGSAVVSGGAGDDTLYIGYSSGKDNADVHKTLYTAYYGTETNAQWESTFTTETVALDHSTIYGGTGNDAIMIGDGEHKHEVYKYTLFEGSVTTLTDAHVYGGEGNDTIQITGKTLTMKDASVEGDTGADNISITGGTTTLDNVTVNGGEDNDTLYVSGSVKNSLVDGGYGDDAITVGGTLANTTVDGGAGNDTITVNGTTGQGAEIFGGMGADVLDASGTTGGARLFGGTGNDTLTGGTGDDYLHGGSGMDEISGGAGNDLIVYDIMDSKLDGGGGIDFVLSEDSDLTMDKLLNGWQGGPLDGPHAENVEVLIKGAGVKDFTSLEDAGITVDNVNNSITLSAAKGWTNNGDGTYTHENALTHLSCDLEVLSNTLTVIVGS